MTLNTVDDHFVNKEAVVLEIYDALIDAMSDWKGVQAAPKKTSIHPDCNASFAGVHTRKKHINLNIQAVNAIENPRISRQEQVSRNRFHKLVHLAAVADVNDELTGWLLDGYLLSK